MKKVMLMILSLIMCCALCACSLSPNPVPQSTPSPIPVETSPAEEFSAETLNDLVSDLTGAFVKEDAVPEETENAAEAPQPTAKAEEADHTEEKNTSEDAESAASDAEDSDELIDGMRPEFIEAMDSYEEFFEEYCEFMQKYAENSSDLSLLADYTSFVLQYQDMMAKLEAMAEEDLNDAELKYYTKTLNRINEMLLDSIS